MDGPTFVSQLTASAPTEAPFRPRKRRISNTDFQPAFKKARKTCNLPKYNISRTHVVSAPLPPPTASATLHETPSIEQLLKDLEKDIYSMPFPISPISRLDNTVHLNCSLPTFSNLARSSSNFTQTGQSHLFSCAVMISPYLLVSVDSALALPIIAAESFSWDQLVDVAAAPSKVCLVFLTVRSLCSLFAYCVRTVPLPYKIMNLMHCSPHLWTRRYSQRINLPHPFRAKVILLLLQSWYRRSKA